MATVAIAAATATKGSGALPWCSSPLIWASVYALASVPVYALWGTSWWFSLVPHLMRV